MINWFDMPAEGLSNGGLFEIKELTATENKVYQKDGEVYNKVTVNVEGGGGSSDFSTAEVTLINSGDSGKAVMIPVLNEAAPPIDPNASVASVVNLMVNETMVLNVPLYKGHCLIVPGVSGDQMSGDPVATSYTITSGSATSSMAGVDITGDCTITIS